VEETVLPRCRNLHCSRVGTSDTSHRASLQHCSAYSECGPDMHRARNENNLSWLLCSCANNLSVVASWVGKKLAVPLMLDCTKHIRAGVVTAQRRGEKRKVVTVGGRHLFSNAGTKQFGSATQPPWTRQWPEYLGLHCQSPVRVRGLPSLGGPVLYLTLSWRSIISYYIVLS
jgi:hypothetical protein